MKLKLNYIETELRKRLSFPYKWGRKQSDSWDSQTQFIYSVETFSGLQTRCIGMSDGLQQYAMNRWFNFWSSKAVEQIFSEHRTVQSNVNQYDKFIDFSIQGIPFDHKTSVFPKRFQHSYHYAQNHSKELIEWLYQNQSQQGRKHLRNRLFIVLFDQQKREHWRLKADLMWLKQQIDSYMFHFDSNALFQLQFNDRSILSDVLLLTK